MDSIYFEDQLGLLCWRRTSWRVDRGDYNIAPEHPADRDRGARAALARVAVGRPLAKEPVPLDREDQMPD